MSRICLIRNAIFCKSHNSVEDLHFVVSVDTLPNASSNLEFKVLRKFCLEPIKVIVIAESRQVITMDNSAQLSVGVIKATR